MLREAKDSYRRKVEQKLQENNMREVWDGMKTITGCKKSSSTVEGDVVRANQLTTSTTGLTTQLQVVMTV